jgi:hypothetical protein
MTANGTVIPFLAMDQNSNFIPSSSSADREPHRTAPNLCQVEFHEYCFTFLNFFLFCIFNANTTRPLTVSCHKPAIFLFSSLAPSPSLPTISQGQIIDYYSDDYTTMAEHVSEPLFAAGTIPGAPLGGNHVSSSDSNNSFVENTCVVLLHLLLICIWISHQLVLFPTCWTTFQKPKRPFQIG